MTSVVAQDSAVLDRYSLRAETLTQWRLPQKLNEISGLAFNDDGRLFAVADEAAIVYELDVDAGRIRKTFAYGKPPIRGDFEGIAAIGGRIYLLTSKGQLVSGAEGENGEWPPFETHATGFGDECELEGLAQDPRHRRLLLVCKELHKSRSVDELMIFAWSLETRAPMPAQAIAIPTHDILRRLRTNRLNPSGIAVDPEGGHLLLVASRQRALIELSQDGHLLAVSELYPATRHRQPEGIEVTSDGRLLIADEGGSHKARLAVYQRDRRREGREQ